jgi:hypothetical protein
MDGMGARSVFVVLEESIVFVRVRPGPGLLPTERVLRKRRRWELERAGGLSSIVGSWISKTDGRAANLIWGGIVYSHWRY